MSGGKETPRQKMIGMMYLVLTALLALNVSKEILNAFVIVEEGLNVTNKNFDDKNQVLYSKFAKAVQDDPKKAGQWNDRALKAQKYSKDLCTIVDGIRSEICQKLEKKTKEEADTLELRYVASKDDTNIPTEILIGAGADPENPTGKAKDLKEAIEKYKKDMMDLVPEKDRKGLDLGLSTEEMYSVGDHMKISWAGNMFEHNPAAAVLSMFAKIKNDVKNAESDVVNILLKAVSGNDLSFDAVEAKVVANANYITAGDEYTADIFVAAHSSTQNPVILIGKVDTSDVKNIKLTGEGVTVPVTAGVGKYVIRTGAEGDQEYSGVIKVKGPDGVEKPYPFSAKYTVAKPSMAVSPTKMNVFYVAIDNPVDISVAGVAPKDVTASLGGGSGTIKPIGGGHFIVNVTKGDAKGECTINVMKKTSSGSKSAGPPVVFRVKKVPSPAASFAGVKGDGFVSAGEVKLCSGVIPQLDDFVFDLKFPVISWNMSMMVNGLWVDKGAQGPGTTGEQKNLLTKVAKGSRILIEDVWVMAPDGKRKIAGCTLKIK
jgi:gliding motility-associated protein GldM